MLNHCKTFTLLKYNVFKLNNLALLNKNRVLKKEILGSHNK